MINDSKPSQIDCFSHHQLVHEFQATCAPRQRALLSTLAVSIKHKLDTSEIVASFSDDLPRTPLEARRRTRKFYWSRVRDFADELKRDPSIPEALEKFPGLLPKNVELAIRLERDNGTLDDLVEAWLNRPPDICAEEAQNNSFVARVIPLFAKTFVILMIAMFVMIRLIPEFKEIFEEFGLELPPIFITAVSVFDTLVKFWFVPLLLLLIAIPFLFSAMKTYWRRWNPFLWQQPILPNSVSVRQALAVIVERGKTLSVNALQGFKKLSRIFGPVGEETNNLELDWNQLNKERIISRREANSLNVAESPVAQAWLLRQSADVQYDQFQDRGMFWTRVFVNIINTILAGLILLLVFSIFLSLITLMTQL